MLPGDAKSDPLNQLKFRRSTCGRTNNWEECVKLLSENSTHLCTIACYFYQSYECHSRFQQLSQCNSTLSLEPLLTASVSQDEGKLVNRWENNAPCESLDSWPSYKTTLITMFQIIPTQNPLIFVYNQTASSYPTPPKSSYYVRI